MRFDRGYGVALRTGDAVNDRLAGVLADLARQLGTTVERLWPELIRYRVAVAVTDLVIGVLLLTVIPLAVWLWKKSDKADWEHEANFIVGAIISSIIGGIGFIWTLIALSSAITVLAAPEAATAMWVIEKMASK